MLVIRDALESQIASMEERLRELGSILTDKEKDRLERCLEVRHEILDPMVEVLRATDNDASIRFYCGRILSRPELPDDMKRKYTVRIKVDTLKLSLEADSEEQALQREVYIMNKFPEEIMSFESKEIKSIDDKPIDLQMFWQEVQERYLEYLEDLEKPPKEVLDALGME